MSTSPLEVAGPEKLIYRVKRSIEQGKPVSFLIGSGVTLKWKEHVGIPSATEIVALIKEQFSDKEGIFLFDEALRDQTGVSAYQRAMTLLVQCQGQPALNEVIAKAVLQSHSTGGKGLNQQDLEEVEFDVSGWSINPALDALAKIYARYEKSIGPILTSNFDPLIGIAIKRFGANISVITMSEDGALSLLKNQTARREVIHFHGYWRGADTLHTADQITRRRPRFVGELRKIINDTTLVVLGYGGWDDVFTETLFSIISEGASESNILWGFHENDAAAISSKYKTLIERLSPQLGKRVIAYGGIDANIVLPEIAKRLQVDNVIDAAAQKEAKVEVKKIYVPRFDDPGCDSPPINDYWTGRSNEIATLNSDSYKVAFLTGIGGLGKSSLAAEFIRLSSSGGGYCEFWDWRDCREEANRMHTNLASICCRLSKGEMRIGELSELDEDELIELLFSLLGETRGLFVFDNVDEYIDLTTFHPDRSVRKLVDAALIYRHACKFIFTCRPRIGLVAARMTELPLSDFTAAETFSLFNKYNIKSSDSVLKALSERAKNITNGHPFWLNIIAAQAVLGEAFAVSFMDAIERAENGVLGNPSDTLAKQILHEVWQRLNEKQRTLLQGLSEAVCQQTEEELVSIMHKQLNYNSLTKSLRKLRQLNLIVTKPIIGGSDGYDLHPLVRRYVRSKFSQEQRRLYIVMFISYFETLISKLRSGLGVKSPLSELSNWSHKIELELNKHEPQAALVTLSEVTHTFSEAGYMEEHIRLADLVFSKLDWEGSIATDVPVFVSQLCFFTRALVELGRYDEADKYLNRLSGCLTSTGVNYLRLSDAYAYRYWCSDDFDKAIYHGRQALELKRQSGADINIDVQFNLALALRDSRREREVEEALQLFLEGKDLISVIQGPVDEAGHGMSFYGNIGRCLQFIGRNGEAFECYKRSLILAGSQTSFSIIRNKGYAYWWISELFENESNWMACAHFNLCAQIHWRKSFPPQERKMIATFREIENDHPEVSLIMRKTDLEIKTYCEMRISKGIK